MLDVRRREFITLLGGAAAWPLTARAQQPTKILKVGTVAGTPRSSPQWVAFERRMVELGYQEGRNFSFDFLQPASADEYEALYLKLASREPDVILAIGTEIGLKSALAVTRTVPIVMIAIDYDPFARGYVTSLARPPGILRVSSSSRSNWPQSGFNSSRIASRIGWLRPCSGTSSPQTNGKQRGAPPLSLAYSFLGLSCASRFTTMRPRSIKHRSIIAVCS
jgi:hypothetical protein